MAIAVDHAMIRWRYLAFALWTAAFHGCTAPPPQPAPSPPATSVSLAPEGGVLLASLGFVNAPPGFSVPASVHITERVDSTNNISLIMTSPDGTEIASYLREHLPAMGFKVTADQNNSLLFTDGYYHGAFTASGALTGLSLRTDQETTR